MAKAIRTLVTGGAGFIGSAIIELLNSQGHEIFVIDNLSFGKRENIYFIDDEHFYTADILDAARLKEIVAKIEPDFVLHLAAIHFIPYCNSHPFLAANINIQGTINLVSACASCKRLRSLLFASTAAVYPIVDHSIDETLTPGPTDIYGLSKLSGESVVKLFHAETGVPVVITRFFNAFGPRETNPHLIPSIQEQVAKGSRTLLLGNLEPKRDYIHTTDMAEAISRLLVRFDRGVDVFNIGSGTEYSVREIVAAFEGGLGERLLVEQDPSRMRKADRMHLLANIRKLSEYINWQPRVGIEAGISALIPQRQIVS